jgi:hypothetical protein
MHRQDPVGAGQGAKISGSASKKAKRGTSGNIGTISGRTARAVSRGLRLGRHADFYPRHAENHALKGPIPCHFGPDPPSAPANLCGQDHKIKKPPVSQGLLGF